MSDWHDALQGAIDRHPDGQSGVAAELGISRVYVCRVVKGRIDPVSPKFVARVAHAYLPVACPYLGRAIEPAECRTYAARTYAQCSQFEAPHWKACRTCPAKAPAVKPRKPRRPNRPQPKATA